MKINFNLESVGKDIAILKNKTTKKKKTIHVSESTEDVRNPFEIIEAKGNEFIQVAPSLKDERSMIYVVGMSGSGKSYWTTQYVKEYLKKNKKNKVHLISPISDDKNINSLKPNRINPNTQAFLDDPPECIDFKDSILICDDIEAYDKRTTSRVMNLVNSIATTGRHHNVSLMMFCHTATTQIVLFPANMTGKSSKYLLDNYFGLDKNQIKNIKNVDSRHVAILRSYPMVIQCEKFIMPLSKF